VKACPITEGCIAPENHPGRCTVLRDTKPNIAGHRIVVRPVGSSTPGATPDYYRVACTCGWYMEAGATTPALAEEAWSTHATPAVEPEQATAGPHVHHPEGPGEYCTGCFDQGAAWATHEERARIRREVEAIPVPEGYRQDGIDAVDPGDVRHYASRVLAAIDGGQADA
jgi:hypothetical protein